MGVDDVGGLGSDGVVARSMLGILSKRIGAAVVVALTMSLSTACAGGEPVESGASLHRGVSSDAARRSVTDVVDRTAAIVDGDWKVLSGPRLGLCPGSDGSGDAEDPGGVTWVYIAQRPGSDDPEDDLRRVEAFWQRLGITTKRYRSGGDDPDLGVSGRGGPLTSIDFLSSAEGGYSIDGGSPCADGDFGELATGTPSPAP
ncbi:hypothetical protein GCM10009706_32320 [Curtobacterium citreum]|uniref:LppA-like lipoprotein n=1 Tax=Curtobacterium citreum TaxID=2036 RepID=A0ABT2HLM3_9MICO|nr:hypothetical protein [Curtobacterium citreum]MCS6524163.1 hypothetical protein [Curtobacterium citreum]TQJ28931.1 hypothetical protein FB462_2836 [Curtobacterium citreum]GGL91295.1 hypothetical protein GCM10009706_32320 [Curtobacterium citreum]